MGFASFAEAQARALSVYGIEAESRMVPGPRGPTHVLACGAGPTVVLVHGLGANSALWAPLLAELRGLTVYAIDLPGHGLTPPRGGLDPENLRGTLVSLLGGTFDALPIASPVPIIGNSLGSLASTWLALDEPGRVEALVHVGCPALIVGASAPLAMRLGSVGGIGPALLKLRRATRAQVEGLAASLGDSLRDRPELSDVLVAQDAVPGYKDAVRELTRTLVRVRGARPQLALGEAELALVRQPVQLVWGDDDPFGPMDVAHRSWAALPDAELQIVRGGHAPWLTDPSAVGRPIRNFLDRSASRLR